MKISYNWLQEYISGKLPKPERIAEILTMHSFEVESVEKAGKDSVLDVAILPNRAHDCLSHIGVAKELAALLQSKVNPALAGQKSKVKEDKKIKVGDYLGVEIKDKERCPLYAARVMLDVRIGPSPKWLKERLETLGQKSINNVVDATNYVMLEMGQPLHAFDLEKINGKKIIVRPARDGEKIKTLGNGEYVLSKKDLVIADAEGALAIAGVKGGVKAEVTAETKNIVLESAYFEPSGARATSRRIGLRTDASWRFENGVVPTLPEKALDRVAGLIAELAGGKIAGGTVRAGQIKPAPARVFFAPDNINKLLGANIGEKEMLAILKRLGFSIAQAKGGYISVAPEERLDISCFQDLAEEVGRVYGFENIVSVLPESVLIPAPPNDELVISDKVKTILLGAGFCETYNRSFVGDRQLDIFSFDKNRAAAVASPMSLEHKYLRPSLLFHLIGNVAENLKHQKSIRLFEVGNVFLAEGKDKISEQTMLAGVATADFYEVKGVVDLLLEKVGIDHEVWYDEYAPRPEEEKYIWSQGRTADIKVGERVIGRAGEIDARVSRSLDIPGRVAAFEFYMKDLMELAEEKAVYRPIGKFPAVERDIAVLVPAGVKVDEAQEVIETAGGELLADSDLFDIYEGEHLEAEQKSLAFHLIFQSPERTLTDREIDGIFSKITEALKNAGWEVR